MSEDIFDPETAPYEELVARANQELQNGTQNQDPDPAANQDPAPEVQDPEATNQDPEAVDEVIYRREIDLGDGSGTQVFEAPSMEELVDKLAIAQANATRKIRELSASKSTQQPKNSQEPTEEDWLLAQELATNPTAAFDKLFQKRFGKTPEEIQKSLARVEQFEREEAGRAAAKAFVDAHPDYVPTPKNGARIEKWLRVEGLEGTPENIEKAFKDLSESGLLETKKPETQAETQSGPRIVTVTSHQRRAASGLSQRRTATTPTKTTGPTEEEAYKMPWDKLVELAEREARQQ